MDVAGIDPMVVCTGVVESSDAALHGVEGGIGRTLRRGQEDHCEKGRVDFRVGQAEVECVSRSVDARPALRNGQRDRRREPIRRGMLPRGEHQVVLAERQWLWCSALRGRGSSTQGARGTRGARGGSTAPAGAARERQHDQGNNQRASALSRESRGGHVQSIGPFRPRTSAARLVRGSRPLLHDEALNKPPSESALRMGRSPSSHWTEYQVPGLSHRSWSCEPVGFGISIPHEASHTRMVKPPPNGHPVPLGDSISPARTMLTASSSRISRMRASRGASPGSTLPPGNSHRPASAGGVVRRAARSRVGRVRSSTMAAPTINAPGLPTSPTVGVPVNSPCVHRP